MVGRWLCFWDGLFSEVVLLRVLVPWIMGRLDTLKLNSRVFAEKKTCLHIGMPLQWPPGSSNTVDPQHHVSLKMYPKVFHAWKYQHLQHFRGHKKKPSNFASHLRTKKPNIQGALCDTKNRSNPRPTVVRIVGGLMFQATNLHELQVIKADAGEICFLLLMEEIRRPPVEVGSLSHYLQGFVHRRWLTWFLPSTVSPGQMCEKKLMEGAISPVPFAVRKGCVLFFTFFGDWSTCSVVHFMVSGGQHYYIALFISKKK